MKVEYFAETDTLYIRFREGPGADADEIAPGVVVDIDAEGRLVGMEIDPASSVTDPTQLETNLAVKRLKPASTA